MVELCNNLNRYAGLPLDTCAIDKEYAADLNLQCFQTGYI